MRVFISWSGDLSKQLADAIRKWLPSALQFVKPYFTPSDVDKGARWSNEISKELAASAFGIIVLTPDNLRSPWINFEAGAISRTIEQGKVCPIVFGMEPTDVEWPLAQFQATRFTEEDIRSLFNTINTAAATDNKLSDSVADGVFRKWWPDLQSAVDAIMKSAASHGAGETIRSDRHLVEEVLSLVRSIHTRQEQIGANQSWALWEASRYPHGIAGTINASGLPIGYAGTGPIGIAAQLGIESPDSPLAMARALLTEQELKLTDLEAKVDDLVERNKKKQS